MQAREEQAQIEAQQFQEVQQMLQEQQPGVALPQGPVATAQALMAQVKPAQATYTEDDDYDE